MALSVACWRLRLVDVGCWIVAWPATTLPSAGNACVRVGAASSCNMTKRIMNAAPVRDMILSTGLDLMYGLLLRMENQLYPTSTGSQRKVAVFSFGFRGLFLPANRLLRLIAGEGPGNTSVADAEQRCIALKRGTKPGRRVRAPTHSGLQSQLKSCRDRKVQCGWTVPEKGAADRLRTKRES